MRIPVSWLKEYLSLPQTPEEIARLLTMAGLEVDHLHVIGNNLKDIICAQVIEAGKHPGADKLSLAKVTDGEQTYQIVCGAPNCRAGIKVALARVGTTVGTGEESFKIKKAKIRGVESEGMMCSEKELGLSEEHEGILELPADFPLGSSIENFYSDAYFDISLTPNLNHCAGVIGVARELAAMTKEHLVKTKQELKEGNEPIQKHLNVIVEDKERCPRYACRMIRNAPMVPSPDWLQQRLEKCGLRSVNAIVDVTNYVLLETGHPLHAFDYDKLAGHQIIVRSGEEGECLQTLDGKKRLLDDSMLLICDEKNPAAIAGVMGGEESEISQETRTIVLESAYFNPSSIRRTSKKLGLTTDASKRFERGADPNILIAALDRAAFLIQQITGGEVLSGIIDIQAKEFPEAIIPCRLSRTNAVIGRAFSRGEVEEIFKRLTFLYEWDGIDAFFVRVPTYRNDIQAEIDLIEEVARVYGYDNIPRTGGHYLASALPPSPLYILENQVRDRLIGEGLQELLTCTLIGPSALQIVQGNDELDALAVKVSNPTSVEQSILRTSTLPGLLQAVKYNFDHQNRSVAAFEIGKIYYKDEDQYQEQSVVGIVLSGTSQHSHWDEKEAEFNFFDLNGIIENFLQSFGVSGVSGVQFKNLALDSFHSGRQASIFVGSLEMGSFGEIHPAIQRRLDIPQRILFGELNLHDLIQAASPLKKVKSLPIYPCSERDWTLTVKESVPMESLFEMIQKQNSPLLEEVSLKDIYRSEKLTPGFLNATFHFVYRDLSKTIEQEAVEAEHKRLTTHVLKELET